MKKEMDLVEALRFPDEEFSPAPFWFFNDAFDEKRVRDELEDYVAKGVNAFVLHPRIGVPKDMPYLSETYFDAVKFIVKTADELGMRVVLYDEGMYPSGSAHGMVVEQNPDFASKGIHLVDEDAAKAAGEQIITKLPDGQVIAYGFTHGTIRGIHFGEDDGEAGAPKSADILNPDAVDAFIHLTHDAYYEHLKEYFGGTVIAFFTDEPCALGRNAGHYREWTPGLEEEIEAAGGKREDLIALFSGKAVAGRADIIKHEENDTVLLYHKLIKQKLRETFYARLSNWCKVHGISFIGHPAESDDIEEELYFHIPGQDLIMRRVAPETGGLREFDSVQAKITADIARHLGLRRNANECFGVCNRGGIPWYFTGKDMKWYIDWLGFRGVNFFIPHAFFYSVTDKRSGERPPDVGPNNIWWPYYRQISDYIKRLSFLMTDSETGAKCAVLCDNNKVPYEEIATLYENQKEFHYLPAAFLEKAVVAEGKVRAFGTSYDVILNCLGAGYAKRFEAFKDYFISDADKVPASDVVLSAKAADLRMTKLTKWNTEMVLFLNEGADAIERDVTIPGFSHPLFFDLWKGKFYTVEGAGESFTLYLEPSESLLVIEDAAGLVAKANASQNDSEGFAVEVRKSDWFRKEYPDFTRKFELLTKSDNAAEYHFEWNVENPTGEEAFLVCGEEMAECFVNGEFMGVSLYGPHRFEVGAYLHSGANEVRVKFTGNAANIYENAGIFFGLEEK